MCEVSVGQKDGEFWQMTNPSQDVPGTRNSNEDKELTPSHQRFFDAAEPLFERFGYKKTTVEDVCRAAGMSKRTFYDLFDDKQDLLMQLTEAVINDATDVWEAGVPPDADPLGRLHSFLDFYANMVRDHPFMSILVEDLDLMRMFGARTDEIRASMDGINPLNQTPLKMMTAHDPRGFRSWGDLTGGPGTAQWLPPDGFFNTFDFIAMLMNINQAGGPPDPWMDLEIDHVITVFGEISFLIQAFEGEEGYLFFARRLGL